VARSASPAAPAQTIAREAQVARTPDVPPAKLDYGREIELPNQIPPPEPVVATPSRRETVEVAAHAEVTEAVAVPVAASASAVEAPRHAPAGAPAMEPPRPAPASPRPREAEVPRSRESSAATHQETVKPREVPKSASHASPVAASAPEGADSATASVVVPITLPANGTAAELVIRIVLKRPD
jgi:hypothetical protein